MFVTRDEIVIRQPDDCWHLMPCSKSVTQNYDNRGTGHCADDTRVCGGGYPSFSHTGKNVWRMVLRGRASQDFFFFYFFRNETFCLLWKITFFFLFLFPSSSLPIY